MLHTWTLELLVLGPLKSRKTLTVICNVLVLFASSISEAAGADLLFQNVRLFDGQEIRPKTSVLVRDGRIVSVGPSLRPPKAAQRIDGRGKTLLPGLIDAHTHASTRDSLRQAARLGVTTQIDLESDLCTRP
jgi:cytosine/adenosine deaminase-related metal-dependent hydrolase